MNEHLLLSFKKNTLNNSIKLTIKHPLCVIVVGSSLEVIKKFNLQSANSNSSVVRHVYCRNTK